MRDVQRLRARAAVCRQVTPHWGRHNAASQQIMKGASDTAVDKSAGWQSPKMKKRYTHLSPEFAKDVANALDLNEKLGEGEQTWDGEPAPPSTPEGRS
jgi:site-specific recombinase XerD